MLSRTIRIQVAVFVIIALVGVSYVGARYVGVFGGSGYVVKLRLADSGGIFTNAEVTYRGVAIGRVGELHLADQGIEVDLRIDDGAPPVPVDVEAVVTNRSAVGEQYVDLRPRRDAQPYLADGSVIETKQTKLPLPTETVLLNLDRLVESVPTDALRTVVDELHEATRGAGPDLQALLDSTASFTKLATTHLPQTTQLITGGGTVLTTQLQTSDAIKSFGVNAKLIARRLKDSDGDIRALLKSVPAVAGQVSGLVRESGPGLGVVMANLLTTSNVVVTRQRGMEELLVVTPAAVSAASQVIRPDGAHFGLAVTYFEPLPCTSGYEATPYRNGRDTASAPLNTAARCTLPPGSPTGVRGSQNSPGG
ncbi:MCE family protein [Kibdelosporangium phytohabitans]|uniref:ABC transporter substrate-binding protein n=1 Tax=Kibdelosporangium phytohabitans TaxID=860235 RepID=A0A0N9I707_9PSEU|nr:MlaD family protein [Kibdelosporangium phytohabitans]ALG11877.1 ABC transporter substrate-binding protein [Kibdelosporangium phytohabitans]MBE1463314.1 phospholipid/cholesterol/gamma-HCH transport system substrate-binding protein [Kibdelosporangium phytohabitans]